ncbi:MAG: hypothetical protein H0T70_01795 [Acidimicrobiia bacterium]|nr:hypothetical protein [Acidimicrobiia bacterium]
MDLDFGHGFIPRIASQNYKAADRCLGPASLLKKVFDAWYFNPGGVFGAYPGPLNKHAFVTGQKTGFRRP